MPKKVTGREQTIDDIRAMWQRLRADYPDWVCKVEVHYVDGSEWLSIRAWGFLDGGDEGACLSVRRYHTLRSPSYMTDQWRVLFELYMAIQRFTDGLPQLVGVDV